MNKYEYPEYTCQHQYMTKPPENATGLYPNESVRILGPQLQQSLEDWEYVFLGLGCRYNPREHVRWPTLSGGRRRVGLRKRPPEGATIDAMFRNWSKGLLDERFKGAIDDGYGPEPVVWLVCCRNCPERVECRRRKIRDNKLIDCFEKDFPFVWKLPKRLRRAIAILVVLGTGGQRPGGYFVSDLRRIIGATDIRNTITQLEKWGFLEGKGSRRWRFGFTFTPEPSLFYIGPAKKLVRSIAGLSEHTSIPLDPKDIARTPYGFILGERPPEWFIKRLEGRLWSVRRDMDECLKNLSSKERSDWRHYCERVVAGAPRKPVLLFDLTGFDTVDFYDEWLKAASYSKTTKKEVTESFLDWVQCRE